MTGQPPTKTTRKPKAIAKLKIIIKVKVKVAATIACAIQQMQGITIMSRIQEKLA